MIDCGGTKSHLLRSLMDLDLSTHTIDALLITHDHHDHVQQIKHFLHVPTYSPISLETNHVTMVYENEPFMINECTITPIGLSHDSHMTVGYIIEDEFEKLVFITDTGYVKDSVIPLIKDADYYIIESNHDPMMLMQLKRPHSLKARILYDNGHLCNQDSAIILSKVITEKTKEVLLAHISEEANTIGLALHTVTNYLRLHARVPVIRAAKQFEIVVGGSI